MDHGSRIADQQEFLPLTDSLASRIRWRACDYAALISAEFELMVAAGPASERSRGPVRCREPALQSEIRLLLRRSPREACGHPDAALPARLRT